MKRIVSCPYCDTQQGVILISTKERIDIEHKCINPKCEREYLIPINYKKVFLSRTFSVSDAKYKFPHHVKTYHSGIVIPIDLLDYKLRLKTRLDEIEVNEQIIDESDILVAYINQPTFRTTFEIARAHEKNIPVYIIDMNMMWANDPWIRHVSSKTFFNMINVFNIL